VAQPFVRIVLTPLVLQTLEIDWVVEETTTLVKKARLRQGHAVYVSPSRAQA
jgi:hypothetical protein